MLLTALILMAGVDDPAAPLSAKMLPVYLKEAREYLLTPESAPKQPLELKAEPVLEWSNPIRGTGGVQQGLSSSGCGTAAPPRSGASSRSRTGPSPGGSSGTSCTPWTPRS